METLLDVKNIQKIYKSRFSKQGTVALRDVSFSVKQNEFTAIMGESGSGKTTLLNLLATLDKPSSGEIFLKGEPISKIKAKDISAFRRNKLGFVFQDYNLLDQFSVKDNILLPLVLSNYPIDEMNKRLLPLAESLRISDLLEKYPYEISGGQCQRAAAARAFITKPQLILADEPTGALDSKSSDMLLETFVKMNEAGQTIIMVTHSARAASYAKRVLFLRDGNIYYEIYKGDMGQAVFRERINEGLFMMNRMDS